MSAAPGDPAGDATRDAAPAAAEADAARAARLDALRRFTSAVAHEIRNPLAAIGAGVQYLERVTAGGPDEREALAMVRAEVRRLDRIVSELAAAGRAPALAPVPALIEGAARAAVDRTAALAAARGVGLLAEPYPRRLPPVSIDPEAMARALAEVVRNAVEASPPGGRVTVRTGFAFAILDGVAGAASAGRSAAGPAAPAATPEPRAAFAQLVRVADEGEGIPPENLSSLFDPFFSTRRGGKGLGLTTSRAVVEAHGGALRVESAPGRGTTVTVYLPAPGSEERPAA